MRISTFAPWREALTPVTIDRFHEPAAETQAYEERLLCLLLMLRDPGLRVVYLSLLGPDTDARERLTMISADDATVRPLSAKLPERPALRGRIREAIPALAHSPARATP